MIAEPTPEQRRHAALMLRWAACLLADEHQGAAVCRGPLERAGYDLEDLEEWARVFAGKALGIVERAHGRAVCVGAGEAEAIVQETF